MSIAVTCQACGSDFNVNDRHAGKRFACRVCQAPVTVPADPRAPAIDAPQSARPRQSSRPASHGNDPQAPTADRIVAACDGCGHRTTVGRELVDRRVRCKKCDQVFRIAAADAQPTSAPPRPARPAPVAPQDEWPVPPPIVNRATHPAPAQDGFNLADLLPGESAEAGIKLAPLAPLPERKHVPAPVAAESPSSEKLEWWERSGGRMVALFAGGGLIVAIVLVFAIVGVRTTGVRNLFMNGGRPSGSAGGNRVLEAQRKLNEYSQDALSSMSRVHDVESARRESPQLAKTLFEWLAYGRQASKLGPQRMTRAQQDELEKLKAEHMATANQTAHESDRVSSIPGVPEALFAEFLARGGTMDDILCAPFGTPPGSNRRTDLPRPPPIPAMPPGRFPYPHGAPRPRT